MKNLLLISFAFVLSLWGQRSFAQPGQNCFTTQFHNAATSLDMNNAYLLGYLCTMSYADYLRFLMSDPPPASTSTVVTSLQKHNDAFLEVFKEKLAPLFTPVVQTKSSPLLTSVTSTIEPPITGLSPIVEPNVSFRFIHKCSASGYDPEAIVISTPSTVFIVFRGTDRVSCNETSFGYEWNEWFASDFKFLKRNASILHPGIRGQVHSGMVESLMLENFAAELATTVAAVDTNKLTKAPKKIWITGHSLGGAHAQLFALYLKYNFNIKAQGLYLYEAPNPGDQDFVNQLNNDLGKSHIQRFEFGDDPIPDLPPQSLSFARAGERNYFKDYNSSNFRSEQTLADDARALCVLGNLPTDGALIPKTASFVFPQICPGSTCFHHPTYILKALRHQLNVSSLSLFPSDVPLPAAGDNCNAGQLTKAGNNDFVDNTITAAEITISQITWQAGNIVDNLIGNGFPEGNYKLSCYAFKDHSKKYLQWDGTVGHQLKISTAGTIFTISHKLTGGYQLWSFAGNMAADVNFTAGLPNGTERTNNVIMKSKDFVVGDEETWYFFKLPNSNNSFVLYNWNTHKVLGAPDDCISGGSCSVNELDSKSNEATQVWILEKQ